MTTTAGDADAVARISSAEKRKAAPVKLNYKETRELTELPSRIEALEKEQREAAQAMSGSEYHKRGAEQMRKDAARATAIESELEAAFERWVELEARQNASR